jgi:hypothetical protein
VEGYYDDEGLDEILRLARERALDLAPGLASAVEGANLALLDRLLAEDPPPEARVAALLAAIERTHWDHSESALELLDQVALRLSRFDAAPVEDARAARPRPTLLPVHAAALTGRPVVLERLAPRLSSLDTPLPHEVRFSRHGVYPPGGGGVPSVVLHAGLTALDAVEKTLEVVQAIEGEMARSPKDSEHARGERAAKRAGLAASREWLIAHGASRGAARNAAPRPEPAAPIGRELLRLAAAVGADVDAVRRALDLVDTHGFVAHLFDALAFARGALDVGTLEARPSSDSPLLHFLRGEHQGLTRARRRWAEHLCEGTGDPSEHEIQAAVFNAGQCAPSILEGRAGELLRRGAVLGGEDLSSLFVGVTEDLGKTWLLYRVTPDSVEEWGDVPTFLRNEVDRLLTTR